MIETYPVGKGTAKGYLAIPESGSGPAVLVLHAWWGLNDFFQAWCDRLASAGFVAFALDLYKGEVVRTVEEAEGLRGKIDRRSVYRKIEAGVHHLLMHPAVTSQKIGLNGFSLGANYTLWTAEHCPDDVAAAILFYGTRGGNYPATRAAFQGHYAEMDPYETADDVRKLSMSLNAAGREVDFYTYPGTRHWFMETDRPEYVPDAAEAAWERSVTFLQDHLKP